MLDIFLFAPTREALVVDLSPLGVVANGEFVSPAPGAALYVGQINDGVGLLLRCDATMALAVYNSPRSAGTIVMEPPEGVPRFAGDGDLDLSAIALSKSQEAKDGAEAFLAPYAAEYGAIEMSSWPAQLREAESFQGDPDAATPWLDAASTARGMDKSEFAARIVANAAAWSALQGHVNGQRLKFQDQVDAIMEGEGSDTVKALGILGIVVEYQMPGV